MFGLRMSNCVYHDRYKVAGEIRIGGAVMNPFTPSHSVDRLLYCSSQPWSSIRSIVVEAQGEASEIVRNFPRTFRQHCPEPAPACE